jgi:hypothetical protein
MLTTSSIGLTIRRFSCCAPTRLWNETTGACYGTRYDGGADGDDRMLRLGEIWRGGSRRSAENQGYGSPQLQRGAIGPPLRRNSRACSAMSCGSSLISPAGNE